MGARKPEPSVDMGFGWRVGKLADPNVTVIDVPLHKTSDDFWVLVRSDCHWDNTDCDRDLEMLHLEQARERNAAIIDNGDLFCAMQGKYDKRSSKSHVRTEHQHGNYLDRLVETAADYYTPYARQFVVLGHGNHETSILNRHETNLTARLAERLNDRTGSQINGGHYSGWVKFRFTMSPTRKATKNLWHIHGYGGGGPATKDMIQMHRQMVYVETADIMVSGHVHQHWSAKETKLGLSQDGSVYQRDVFYLKATTYKDEYRTGSGGWHIETGKSPRPLGAWWIRFYKRSWKGEEVVMIEPTMAERPIVSRR
jgi:UDP-2,3-diacylglucosamine pyrophosphatase LpxH